MAGRVQLEAVGPQDKLFTDDPEYTYFIKNFKKHGNYSKFYTDLDFDGRIEFGEEVRCTIPQNQGDLLKGVSVKVTLNPLDQNLVSGYDHITYCESIAQAMIEYADIYIGGSLIQRVPSDMLAIHSELYVTQSKQRSLSKLVGKPFRIFSVFDDYYKQIRENLLTESKVETSYRVDIPFYFHEYPELAVPLYAITNQEIEIVIKLRKAEECIFAVNTNTSTDTSESYYIGQNPTGLIKSMNPVLEMVSLDKKIKNFPKRLEYTITQTQQNTLDLNNADGRYNAALECNEHEVRLEFKNSVKELFFIVQDKLDNNPGIQNDFVTPFQYSSINNFDNHVFFTNSEQVKYIGMTLDGAEVLNDVTGNLVHIRAIQAGKHHSRTPIYRRFYMYNFGLEPERWYPTGQLNFSNIKNQLLKIGLFDYPTNYDKQLRVYAQSYNILRVENGTAKLLFET
jgi:hypothetical protein